MTIMDVDISLEQVIFWTVFLAGQYYQWRKANGKF